MASLTRSTALLTVLVSGLAFFGCNTGSRTAKKGNFGPGSGQPPPGAPGGPPPPGGGGTPNTPPTIDQVINQGPILVALGPQSINLTNITAVDAGQAIQTITAISSVPTVVANPQVALAGGTGPGATLDYIPLTAGTTTITVTVVDDGGVASGGSDTTIMAFDIIVAQNLTLTINEIDYDMAGADVREFVEIWNGTGVDVPLAGIELHCINGATGGQVGTSPYDLTAGGNIPTLPAGAYLVVADDAAILNAAPGAFVIDVLPLGPGPGDILENGVSDGVVLFDTNTNTALDSVGWEGPTVTANLGAVPTTVNVGEVGPAPTDVGGLPDDSIGRNGVGADTDDNTADFTHFVAGGASPGASN